MWKKRLFITLFLIISTLIFQYILHPHPKTGNQQTPLTSAAKQEAPPILLIPLDSRPPCKDFVINGGKIIGRKIHTPPTEYMDYYTQPGDTAAIRTWLTAHAGESDAIILSIDQLLSGGLIAAREAHISEADISALEQYLRTLHAAHPKIPLHAFYILPRAIPQDTIEDYHERRALLAYARLMGRAGEGLPVNTVEQEHLRAQITPEHLQIYLSHFKESTALASMLIELAHDGTLTRLVLGQDDGEPYSIGNIEKAKLKALLTQKGIPPERALIVHGADEIALSMLARMSVDACIKHGENMPRVALCYADDTMQDAVFPFMAVSNDITAREKIILLGGTYAETPEDADMTLFISAGDSNTDTLTSRIPAAAAIKKMLAENHRIALVDLSRHFCTEETLLPILLQKNVPVNALTAYAGWNTASNAIGTALSEAILYHCAMQRTQNLDDHAAIIYANLAFLQGRIIEDAFYLKEGIDRVNNMLRITGYTNTADLDLTRNWRWANDLLIHDLNRHIRSYESTPSFRTPFRAGGLWLHENRCNITAYYPWPRTFEIHLTSAPEIEVLAP